VGIMQRGTVLRSFFDLRGWAMPLAPLVLPTAELFANRLSQPSEEEQVRFYRRIGERGLGSPIILTLFDGNSPAGATVSAEIAAREGQDGFHYWKDHPLVLQRQLCSLLVASFYAPLWILAGNLRRREEFEFLQERLQECLEFLRQQGCPFDRYPKVGYCLDSPSGLEAAIDARYDFLVLDLDRLATLWLGLPGTGSLRDYLPFRENELAWLRLRLDWIPFSERWVAVATHFIDAWEDLRFPFQALLESRGLES
jgi:hypothetical protein